MLQCRKIINLALSKIGAINFGENPDTATSEVVLDNLKLMLDELSIRYSNYKVYAELETAKNVITLGTDFSNQLVPVFGDVSARPAQISDVIVKIGNINYPQIIKPYAEYNRLPVTNINAIPTTAYIEYGFPFVTISFFPGFGTQATIFVYGKSYLTDDDLALNDYIDIPRELNSAIVSNLALRIAPTFGIPTDQSLVIQASADLKHIKQRQLVEGMRTLDNDFYGMQGFNLIAGR